MSNLLKSKLLLGVMTVAIMFVGAVAVNATTAAASCSITSTLKLGSTGAQVVCLQTALGGLTADGNFGAKTKAAVIAWQTSEGLTADGVFGAKSIAKWMGNQSNGGNFPSGCTSASGFSTATGLSCAGSGGSNLPAGCSTSSGFSPTTGMSCSVLSTLPAGCSTSSGFSPTTGSSCSGTGVVVGNGNNGSITLSQSSYVSSGVTLKKGDTKDVVAVRLQASGGPVQVTRVVADFNLRPWLVFNQVTLHDNTGKVLATKSLNSIADVNEVTVGSVYQVTFDNLNYTVNPGTNIDLAIGVTVLPATDKITNSQVVYVTIPSNGIRTLSGSGWTDSLGGPDVSSIGTWTASTTGLAGLSATGDNSFLLTSTGSIADIYSKVSQNSPTTGQQVVNATSGQTTTGVTLGGFGLKSANNSSTLNTLQIAVAGSAPIADFTNFRLLANGTDVGGASLSSTTLTFNNLNIPLNQDSWVDFLVKADIAGASNGTVLLTLTPSSSTITVTDSNYNTANVEAGPKSTNTLTLTSNALVVSNTTATLGSAIVQSNSTVGYNATYAFTLTNNSNNDLFVSSNPNTVATNAVTGTGSGSMTSVTVSPSTVTGDDLTNGTAGLRVYDIPTGSQRTFTFSATLRGTSGTSTTLPITAINYGVSAANVNGTPAALQVLSGLSALTLTAAF